MTLTEAEMNYPWDDVMLLAHNPDDPKDTLVFARKNGKTYILEATDDWKASKTTDGATEKYSSPMNKDSIVIERSVPKDNKEAVKRLIDIENWDWKPLRSFCIGAGI